jgi:hypothetical protein
MSELDKLRQQRDMLLKAGDEKLQRSKKGVSDERGAENLL